MPLRKGDRQAHTEQFMQNRIEGQQAEIERLTTEVRKLNTPDHVCSHGAINAADSNQEYQSTGDGYEAPCDAYERVCDELCRIKVPGGWIYESWRYVFEVNDWQPYSTVFVPTPVTDRLTESKCVGAWCPGCGVCCPPPNEEEPR